MNEAPTSQNTGGVVITYNPGDGLESRVSSLARHVDHVLIVDNGSDPPALEAVRSLETLPAVELRLNGRNLGVATALNQGAEWARQRRYHWLLLSDHDTHFDEDALKTLQAVWRDYPERDRIAVIGCNFVDSNIRSLQYDRDPSESPWSERETVISSGSLLSLSAFERVGPLRDDFFIDQVDHEYCLRARSKGFRILATGRPVMRHSVGTGTSHGRFGFVTLNHPPQRWYYLLRNEMSLVREYLLREPHWVFITVISRIQKTLVMILFEQNRFAKLRCAAAGFVDGVLGRFGQARV